MPPRERVRRILAAMRGADVLARTLAMSDRARVELTLTMMKRIDEEESGRLRPVGIARAVERLRER